MYETISTAKFISIELVTRPVPPGTKGTPRPANRPLEVYPDDDTEVQPPVFIDLTSPLNPPPDGTNTSS